MAGDWIKVERATLDKPEILEAAELLGIGRREALGLFVDYFVWLDQHLDGAEPDESVPQVSRKCPGVVPHVSRKSLEVVLGCPGFAAVLETINWGKFDDRMRTLTVINSERHNGRSAKSRALEQKKKAIQRSNLSRICPVVIGTESGPEKRREENIKTKSNTKAARKRAMPIPEPFELTDSTKAWGIENNFDLSPYMVIFIGRHAANGKTYIDWQRAFQNCVREDWYELRSKNGRKSGAFESKIAEQERVLGALTGGIGKGRTIKPSD